MSVLQNYDEAGTNGGIKNIIITPILGGVTMSGIDKRNKLTEEPFSYKITKKGMVIVYYDNKQIVMIKDKEAERLIAKINSAKDNATEVQLLLAKITGNFKRGNEKLGKRKNN